MKEEKNFPDVLKKIDWTTLRTQKATLLKVIDFCGGNPETAKFINDLDGILNLIDALQDYAVDEMGVPEMHVFDFELEEDREKSTPNEIFARECAESIFDELCESDGFHTDDEMPSAFIETIMADDKHADIIKGKMRYHILDDLNKYPDAFTRNENGNLVYDSRMREDYEGVATEYIRELYNKDKTKSLWLCPNCGSDNVEFKVWANANTNEVSDTDAPMEDEDCFCNDCKEHGELILSTVKADAKIEGFQVVDDEAGDIHPDMDGSFCLYNMSQAQKMLHSKHDEGNWKLLAIWTGDVEEPTIMFEGDPRD